jgi:hypothetical protein
MATKINVRSPYYIKVSNASLASATLDLYIYTGVFSTDKPASAQYTLIKNEINSNNYVVFEIAELVRDYIDIEFDGDYDSQCVWVEADINIYDAADGGGSTVGFPIVYDLISFDGYGYFHEGKNPELSRGLLMSNRSIFRLNDSNVTIPVFTEDTNSVSFYYQGVLKRTQTIPSTGVDVNNTNGQIEYISVAGQNESDTPINASTYEERVVADGGTFEDSVCLQNFLSTIDIGLVDEVWVNYDTGTTFTGASNTSTEDTKTDIVKIHTVDECKYEPYKVTFVNKYGALQDVWFFKKSVETTDVTSEQFKASIFNQDTLSYKTHQHQQQAFMSQGKDRITMNTGYVNDDHNAVMEELLLSEQVWYTKITDEELVVPVIPRTKTVTYKTSINDKLVNYTIEFEHAFDKINNIR